MGQFGGLEFLNHLLITLFLVITMILIARTAVAGTRYSPVLIIVIFGLAMGYILQLSGIASPGLIEFPVIDLVSKMTLVALTVSFFVGGQELRKIISNIETKEDTLVNPSQEEIILGTKSTQLFYIVRAFFVMMGIDALFRITVNINDSLTLYYPLLAYIGIAGAMIFIDHKATVKDKPLYIRKGVIEILTILAVVVISFYFAQWIRPVIALPHIFFAMLLSAGIGAIAHSWIPGPTVRSMLFAGIPIVLAANFMIGGSRIADAFQLPGMTDVMLYGFFGQIFWMFGGISILIFLAKSNHVRNIAPAMAGGLSHSGLTGACTAGDLGGKAASRAPIMINIPFFAHIFVFSVLAISAQQGELMIGWALLIALVGIVFTVLAIRTLRASDLSERNEVKGLMQFSLGWQLTAIFGGLLLVSLGNFSIDHAVMAQSSALSHFGLFAAIQGGMFGDEAALLIPFIFAMPFLVHPFVFWMFGKAMERDGQMPAKTAFVFALIGVVGVIYALVG
ncbi:hypothetical protein [Desulfuribacillus alkaliarsenatis]|nr:hypothetical protein [Desulfuribacillus alkaliarsenatis]